MRRHLLLTGLFLCLNANAAFVDQPLPDNAFITKSGLDWAWAGQCAPIEPSCGILDLSYQSQFGWRLPTAEEMLLVPDVGDFAFDGANTTMLVWPGGYKEFNGPNGEEIWFGLYGEPLTDVACAAAYFGTVHKVCDWDEGVIGHWWGTAAWAAEPDLIAGQYDTLLVRTSIPVPAAIWLFGSALTGLGCLRRTQLV